MTDRDVELVKFFHGVVRDEMGRNAAATHKESLKKVTSLRGHRFFQEKVADANLTLSALRCAHVYQYSPCITSALTSHFRRLLKDNSFLLHKIVRRGRCSVCCLSTGPTTELVAMVRALGDVLRTDYSSADNRLQQRLKIEVVVVNFESCWNGVTRKMANNLHQIVDESVWKIGLRFLRADLAKPLTDDVKGVLGQSDLVTMIHFLSSIHKSGNSLQTTQEIVPFIGEGATLFMLDFPDFHLCGALRDVIGSYENMVEIYGPISYDIHRVSFLCRKECLKLYSKYYGWRYCELESISYVCAWQKKTSNGQSCVSGSR